MRRLATTTLRTTRSFASARATPRIAICGAGVSGLTLAGILSNGTCDVQLTEDGRGTGARALRRDLCGNQISGAARHRRDNISHWLISTQDWEDFREMNPLPAWVPFPVARFAVKRFAALTKAWYAWERKRGGGGTCRGNAPLYASVERLLAEQKK